RDATIPPGTKSLLHRHLVELGVVDRLPSEEEEREDPNEADNEYLTCANWLRQKALELKSKSPFDVVHSENISYGYRRNILGIKPYGLLIVCFGLVVTIAAFFFQRQPYIELISIAVVGAYLVFGVTKAGLKRAADE